MRKFYDHELLLMARALDEWADAHEYYTEDAYPDPADNPDGYDFDGTAFERGCHLILVAHARSMARDIRQHFVKDTDVSHRSTVSSGPEVSTGDEGESS